MGTSGEERSRDKLKLQLKNKTLIHFERVLSRIMTLHAYFLYIFITAQASFCNYLIISNINTTTMSP